MTEIFYINLNNTDTLNLGAIYSSILSPSKLEQGNKIKEDLSYVHMKYVFRR